MSEKPPPPVLRLYPLEKIIIIIVIFQREWLVLIVHVVYGCRVLSISGWISLPLGKAIPPPFF